MDIQLPYILVLFASLLFLFIAVNGKRSSKLPPGPWKLPFIGNLHNMLGLVPHRSLGNLAKKYGPLMQLQLGEVPILVVSSASVATQIMKTNDLSFADRPEIYAAKVMLYDCSNVVFSRYGDYWREMRKIFILQVLSAKHVLLFRPLREEEVSNTIRSISSQAGVPVNLSKRITSLFNTITSRAAFGDNCKVNEEIISMMRESLTLVGGLEDLFPSLKLIHHIGGTKSKLRGFHKEVDKFLEGVIQEHKKSRMTRTKNDDNANTDKEDLIDVLLRVQESGELSLTTENIKALVWEIIGAGTDTLAVAVLWAMSELLRNRRAMEKVQTEVRRVFDGKKQIEQTDVKKLEYLILVIKETLRLHPPAPLTLRESCEIDGYDIPAKTKVIINLWAIGMDPDYWSDPDTFEPERFASNSVDYKGNNFEYIPFGAGRRMCPGMSFAMANVELTLAHLLYHFDWKTPKEEKPEHLDMSELFGISVDRKNDLVLIPIPFISPNCGI